MTPIEPKDNGQHEPADPQLNRRQLLPVSLGNSIRATVRMTGVAKNTVAKLVVDLGAACAVYQDEKLRNLTSKRLQCDEIWSFCYAKRNNVTEEILGKNPDAGDVWTWTCFDPD